LIVERQVTEMESIEILYDHYKDTYALSKVAQERRNKSFVCLCILETVAYLWAVDPQKMIVALQSYEILSGFVNLGHEIIQTFLWMMIVYVLIRYVQDMIYVERQYGYLTKLEIKISSIVADEMFSRESSNYLKEYPKILNLIDLFYKMVMPVLFLVLNFVHIIMEWQYDQKNMLSVLCDSFIFTAIFIITWFYFFWIHSKITNYWIEKIPIIKRIDQWLSRELKKV